MRSARASGKTSCRPPKRSFGASPRSCAARAPDYAAATGSTAGWAAEANRRKVEKHFDIVVKDDDLTFQRNTEKIAAEARLDGIYIVRTSLDANALDAHRAVQAYKSLSPRGTGVSDI